MPRLFYKSLCLQFYQCSRRGWHIQPGICVLLFSYLLDERLINEKAAVHTYVYVFAYVSGVGGGIGAPESYGTYTPLFKKKKK